MVLEINNEVPYQELVGAYRVLEKKNKDLIDGLYYAAFVQQGLMPQTRHFKKLNHPFFIYYNPLQIIGGDFFWIGRKDDWCYYAVGDCTGHGVSGAMLSALAIGFLNYVVYSKQFSEVGQILAEIDKKWIETFNHNEDVWTDNDWMELSLIAYNSSTGLLQYSGAGGSIMFMTAAGELIKKRGTNYPVGGWQLEKHRRYQTSWFHTNELKQIYLYSDGYKDQFGGNEGKRIGHQLFSSILKSSAHLDCSLQKEFLVDQLKSWQGTTEQTDDICVLRVDL